MSWSDLPILNLLSLPLLDTGFHRSGNILVLVRNLAHLDWQPFHLLRASVTACFALLVTKKKNVLYTCINAAHSDLKSFHQASSSTWTSNHHTHCARLGFKATFFLPLLTTGPSSAKNGSCTPFCRYPGHLVHSKGRARGSPGASDGEASGCNAGDQGLIAGSGRSSGEGNGNPFQHSCLGNGDKQEHKMNQIWTLTTDFIHWEE